MDFVSKHDLAQIKKRCEAAMRSFTLKQASFDAMQVATDFSYYMVAGTDHQTIIEGVSVAGDGSFIALLLRLGDISDMRIAEGSFHEEKRGHFTGTLEIARQEFQNQFLEDVRIAA